MSTLIPEPNDSDIPQDETPDVATSGPFDPRYPDSTPEAPFGFKPDGTPYKRHHGGRGGSTVSTGRRSAASDKLAETAAKTLGTMNTLIGISLAAFGFNETAVSIAAANEQFENMAAEALLTDPVLCKKILSAGSSSGKVQLTMAYATLGMAIMPAVKNDVKRKREESDND